MAIGPPFLFPIIKYWMKDTTVLILEELNGTVPNVDEKTSDALPTEKEISATTTKDMFEGD